MHSDPSDYPVFILIAPFMDKEREQLFAEHSRAAVQERLRKQMGYSYLGDAILGAIDGCVTTFAVVAGATGGKFGTGVIVVLGFANLLADGFSMAASNYLRSRSDRDLVKKMRAREEHHAEHIPDGESTEVREIFAYKGFRGETLDKIVERIAADRPLLIHTILSEEFGLQMHGPSPLRAAGATFAAFIIMGLIPLLPFLLTLPDSDARFTASAFLTAIAFFGIGTAKGLMLGQRLLISGLTTLLLGGGAALLAFVIGVFLRTLYGESA